MDREIVMEALKAWICDVTKASASATPEEIAALPEVADVYLKNCD